MKDENEKMEESLKKMESMNLVENKDNEKEKIINQKNANINIKEEEAPTTNLNEKKENEIEVKLSDDDLEHPLSLESDDNEEGKEELKKNFYQNKLKEKEKLQEMKKKEKENSLNLSNLKVVKKLEKSYNSISKTVIKQKGSKDIQISDRNEKNDINKTVKKVIHQKDIKLRAKIIEKKVENKGNLNDNNKNLDTKILKMDDKYQNVVLENLERNNINIQGEKKNMNINNEKQIKKISKHPSFQQVNRTRKISQINKSENEINNHINTISEQKIKPISQHNQSHNNTTSERLIKKIQKSMDYNKTIFYDTSVNKTFKVEKPKYDEINLHNIERGDRYSQLKSNEYDFENKLKKTEQKKKAKMKSFTKELVIKSQSYSNMTYNKMHYNRINDIDNKIYIEEKMNTQTNIKHKTSEKIPIQKTNHLNKSMNCYNENKKKINRIPIQLNCQKYINKREVIKNDLHDNKANPKNSKEYKINENKGINNIHNNISFYDNEQREHFKNDSYRKKTIENGGKFNNVQTTYVVISKNVNSKIPKSNHTTIDYGNNKILNPVQSVIFPKSSNYFNQQPNHTYINTEGNIKNNQKFQYFSPYTKEPQHFQKISSYNEGIKTYKSQNLLNIKKNCNYNIENIDNNHGTIYKNYVGCSIHKDKNVINNNQFMKNYYTESNSKKRIIKTMDNCENYDYINYGRNNMQNNAYFPYY